MILSPVIARELLVAARQRATFMSRAFAALAAILVSGWTLLVATAHLAPALQGEEIFDLLSWLSFAYALAVGVRATSDCLSQEKREGTLGLLFLTNLKSWEVILGKVLAASLRVLYALLAILPVLALAMMLGGIEAVVMIRITIVLLNTIFFSLCAGIFVSTISLNERNALAGTVGLIFVITGGPYLAGFQYGFNSGVGIIDPAFLTPSPVYAFILAKSPLMKWPVLTGPFMDSLAATQILSWVLLVLSALIAPRVTHDAANSRLTGAFKAMQQRWVFGKAERRRRFRSALLDRNAFYWLSARNRLKGSYIWIFLGSMGLIWGVCYSQFASFLLDAAPCFVVVFGVNLFFKIWFASEICARFIEDNRSGAWELLLSSPLTVSSLLRGHTLALRRIFLGPLAIIIALESLLLIVSVRGASYALERHDLYEAFAGQIAMLLLDLWALRWLCVSRSLRARSSSRALLAATGRVLLLPSIVFWVFLLSYNAGARFGLAPSATPTIGWTVAVWCSIGFAADLFWGFPARSLVTQELREAVSSPLGKVPDPRPRSASARFPQIGKRVRWTLAGALPLVALCAWAAWQKHSLQREIDRKIAAIQSVGLPVDLRGVNQWLAKSPNEQNAAFQLEEARALISLQASDQKVPPPGKALSRTDLAGIDQLLARNAAALAVITNAIALRQARFIRDYTPGPSILLPHLATIHQSSMLLRLEASRRSARGQTPPAVRAVANMIGLARLLEGEPLIISQLTRVKCLRAALLTQQRVMMENELLPGQLAMLKTNIEGALRQDDDAWAGALLTERAFGLDACRLNPVELANCIGWAGPTPRPSNISWALLSLRQATFIPEMECLLMLKHADSLTEAWKSPFPARFDKLNEVQRGLDAELREHPALLLPRFFLPSLQKAANEDYNFQLEAALALAAVSAEDLKLSRGKWPEKPQDLALPASVLSIGELTFRPVSNAFEISCRPSRLPREKPVPNWLLPASGSTDRD